MWYCSRNDWMIALVELSASVDVFSSNGFKSFRPTLILMEIRIQAAANKCRVSSYCTYSMCTHCRLSGSFSITQLYSPCNIEHMYNAQYLLSELVTKFFHLCQTLALGFNIT